MEVYLAITRFFSSLKYSRLLQPHTRIKIKINTYSELPQCNLGETGLYPVQVTAAFDNVITM